MSFEACRFLLFGLGCCDLWAGSFLFFSLVSGLGFYVSAGLVGFESLGFGLPLVST